MRTLYQYPLCPFSRKVRIILAEKNVSYKLELEKPWNRREDFLALNPAGEVPVLIEKNGVVIADYNAVCEYIDEAYPDPPVIGKSPRARAETRRLTGWFDRKFYNEVSFRLAHEKIYKRVRSEGPPDSGIIRACKTNLRIHMKYLEWLTEHRKWLAGNLLSLADITAAAHLSVLDYIGDINWDNYPETKTWYSKMKSRPSFRSLLTDKLTGIIPASHYDDLDF